MARWATAAACVRERTPSLARMLLTWTLTVFGLMNSSEPIWRLVCPAATRASTSCSRDDRPSPSSASSGTIDGPAPATTSRPRVTSWSTRRSSGWAPRARAVVAAAVASSVAWARSPDRSEASAARKRA